MNLLLVFGEESGLPFYYRKLSGNIPDSKTVKHLLEELDILGFVKTKFVMDRGFYSEENINGLYREHVKFLVGYFALITNETMDAFTALHLYRKKDVVEKAFGNIKERLNLRRLLVSSEKALDGKIFAEFVALILISHLDSKMKKSGLYKTYTMQQLLDKLDVLECFEDEKHSLRIGEMLDKQREIYEALGVEAPTSSC